MIAPDDPMQVCKWMTAVSITAYIWRLHDFLLFPSGFRQPKT